MIDLAFDATGLYTAALTAIELALLAGLVLLCCLPAYGMTARPGTVPAALPAAGSA